MSSKTPYQVTFLKSCIDQITYMNCWKKLKAYQARTILEKITDALMARHGMVNWVLILEFISFFYFSNIRSHFLNHPEAHVEIQSWNQDKNQTSTGYEELLFKFLLVLNDLSVVSSVPCSATGAGFAVRWEWYILFNSVSSIHLRKIRIYFLDHAVVNNQSSSISTRLNNNKLKLCILNVLMYQCIDVLMFQN